MTKKRKLASLIGRLMVLPVIFISMTFPASQPANAAEGDKYNLYIGSTQVTEANKGNILDETNADGTPTAWYEPGTATLHLNGVNIGEDKSYQDEEYGYNYSLYSGTDVVKNLVITGDNSFVSAGHGMLFKVMGPTNDENDNDYAKHSLMITGNGTLTSTTTADDYEIAAMTVVGELNTAYGANGYGGVFMGNEDGTGPRLELTGLRKGANFYETGAVTMQGGTMIAKATKTPGTGVTLPVIASHAASYIRFNGGTIAGYGTYGSYIDEYDDVVETGGAFEGSGDVSWSQLGMQRVYPEPEEGATNYSDESGWCVVGMTKGAHVADTQAVLKDLGLLGKTGGTYHTDTLPDSDADINVWGYTKDTTVYSVDVEWGAMTFEYEATSWDPDQHKIKTGAGWKVYDSATGEVVGDAQHDINKVTVTNHSNAKVFATLSYTGNEGYTDIIGGFSKKTDDSLTVFTAAADSAPAYLTLDTADNNKLAEGQGQETVGNVYFMPSGISTTDGAVNEITQWTKIGKITVGILTEQPQ